MRLSKNLQRLLVQGTAISTSLSIDSSPSSWNDGIDNGSYPLGRA